MYLNFRFLGTYAPLLLTGAMQTLLISLLSLVFGFFGGLIVAVMRQSPIKALNLIGTVWVEVLRNTPFLVQLFFLYFGLPEIGIRPSPIATAVVALSVNQSATNGETIRAGLMAVKKGFYESSYALGFSKFETFRFVIIPITLRLIFRPLTSNFINLILTSSLAFSVTVNELMGVSKTIAASTARPFEVYLVILLGFASFTFMLSWISSIVDRKIAIRL